MIAGLGVDIRPLIPETIRRGGHIRVGLENAPFGCSMTNRALVKEAVQLISANDAEPHGGRNARGVGCHSPVSCDGLTP